MSSAENTTCPPSEEYPTTLEFYNGLGSYAIALYVVAALVICALLVQFLILVSHFWKHVPGSRRVPTLWVNSVYLVIAIATLLSITIPKSTTIVWLFYKVYLAMIMGYFVDLTMAWYGGETKMLRLVGEDKEFNLRKPPCCCCFCICPRPAPLTKKKIKLLRASVYQSAYTQSITIFLLVILLLTGHLTIGDMNPLQPYLYLTMISQISFVVSLYGLFTFFSIASEFGLLQDKKYGSKAWLLKAMVIIVNLQDFVFNMLANYEVVKCVAPYISSGAMALVIKNILFLLESFIVGTVAFRLNVLDHTHL